MAEAATCSVQQPPTVVTRRAVYSGEREAVVGQIAVPEQRYQHAAGPQETSDAIAWHKLFGVSLGGEKGRMAALMGDRVDLPFLVGRPCRQPIRPRRPEDYFPR